MSKQNLQRRSFFVDARALTRAKRLLRVSSDAEAVRVSLERVAEIEYFDRFMEASHGRLPRGSGCDFRRTDDPIVIEAARVCDRVAVFTRDLDATCEEAPCFAPPGMVSNCSVPTDTPGPYYCSPPSARAPMAALLYDGAPCIQDHECSSNECTDGAPGVSERICEPVRTIGWMECELFNDPRIPHGADDGGISGGAATDAGL